MSERPAIGSAIDPETKSYDRIYGMLLGVRVHVSRLASKPLPQFDEKKHYDEVEKMEIPREGNHYAPAHHGRYDYKFKSYAPVVFAYLRHFFGISDEEYLVSLTADYMMSELKTIGRSSAMFYYTWDGRYVLKTLTKTEMLILRKMLHLYYPYVTTHPDTLVNHFFGAYRSQTSLGKPIRFVIMNNVFPIGFQIHYKFDLKGSVINRSVDEEKRNKPGSTWKEAEFEMKRYLQIGPRDWNLLRAQLQDDTNFLANAGVMDYSLLVGIHQFSMDSPIMHPPPGEKLEILSVFTPSQSSQARYDGNSIIVRKIQFRKGKNKGKKKASEKIQDVLNISEKPRNNLAIMPYIPDSQRLLSYCGGLRGSTELNEPISEIYFLGIIDFLQDYNGRKKAEHAFKSMVYKKDEMSCISPKKYAQRMFNFLCKTIGPTEQPSLEVQQQLLRRSELFRRNVTPVSNRSTQPRKKKKVVMPADENNSKNRKNSKSSTKDDDDDNDESNQSESEQNQKKITTRTVPSKDDSSDDSEGSESESQKPPVKKAPPALPVPPKDSKKQAKKKSDDDEDSTEPKNRKSSLKSSSKKRRDTDSTQKNKSSDSKRKSSTSEAKKMEERKKKEEEERKKKEEERKKKEEEERKKKEESDDTDEDSDDDSDRDSDEDSDNKKPTERSEPNKKQSADKNQQTESSDPDDSSDPTDDSDS